MDNIAGPPVEGDNFFGRDAQVATFKETMQHHDVLLLGPRRIGKTSFARAVLKAAAADGWQVIEINVASCSDEKAFVEKLSRAVEGQARSMAGQTWAAIRARTSDLLGRIDAVQLPVPGAGTAGVKLRAAGGEDWSVVATDALRLMGQARQTWLIYVDELPIFLHTLIRGDSAGGVQRVRRFLDWFRNDVRGVPECRQMRWLVTGSVGLDTLVQRYRMADTINSLKHESLAPFTDALAADMVLRLADRYELSLTPDEAQALVHAVQWPQPYYLQLVFNFLRRLAAGSGQPAGGLISKAIDQAVQPGADNDFHHWEERLFMQLDRADAEHAVALLTMAAEAAAGARPEALLVELQRRLPDDTEDAQRDKFIELRDILLRDAYWWLDESSGARRYRFRLELLRRWWLRRRQL